MIHAGIYLAAQHLPAPRSGRQLYRAIARRGPEREEAMDIKHVVVLMLENRSFDCMLGLLYPSGIGFDGLTGTESNTWHRPDGTQQTIPVWTDPTISAQSVCIPDPDPGELFTDIHMQIHGLADDGTLNTGAPTMGGFVDNYMRQPATTPDPD